MIFAIKVLFGPQFPTAVAGWVRGMHVLEVIIDALPRPTDTDHRHPLRVISELSPSDIALVVKGCAEGLERVLNVRPSPHIPPCSRPLLQILYRPSFLEEPRPYGLKPGYPAPVTLSGDGFRVPSPPSSPTPSRPPPPMPSARAGGEQEGVAHLQEGFRAYDKNSTDSRNVRASAARKCVARR